MSPKTSPNPCQEVRPEVYTETVVVVRFRSFSASAKNCTTRPGNYTTPVCPNKKNYTTNYTTRPETLPNKCTFEAAEVYVFGGFREGSETSDKRCASVAFHLLRVARVELGFWKCGSTLCCALEFFGKSAREKKCQKDAPRLVSPLRVRIDGVGARRACLVIILGVQSFEQQASWSVHLAVVTCTFLAKNGDYEKYATGCVQFPEADVHAEGSVEAIKDTESFCREAAL